MKLWMAGMLVTAHRQRLYQNRFTRNISQYLSYRFDIAITENPYDMGRTVACTCQACVACTSSVSMYAWDSQQLAGSKVVLSRDHVVQKKKLLLKLQICR